MPLGPTPPARPAGPTDFGTYRLVSLSGLESRDSLGTVPAVAPQVTVNLWSRFADAPCGRSVRVEEAG